MYMDEQPGPSGRNRGRGYNNNSQYNGRGRGRNSGYSDRNFDNGGSGFYQGGRSNGGYSDSGYRENVFQGNGRGGGYRGRTNWGYQGAPRGRGRGRGRGFQDPDDVRYLTLMRGHTDSVTAMVFDDSSGQLFSASKDGTIRVWDPKTTQSIKTVEVGGEVHSMLFESGILFVGVTAPQGDSKNSPAAVRVYNFAAGTDDTLLGHQGSVYALAAGNNMLFSGGQDHSIRVFQFSQETGKFIPQAELTAANQGHQAPISCLLVCGAFLFSADYKGVIKVWDLSSGQCTQSIENAHESVIMSLLPYKSHILSASVDGFIRVWPMCEPAAPGAVIQPQPAYTHPPTNDISFGKILTLHGTTAPDQQDILLSSCSDDSVIRLWQLPDFVDRGHLNAIKNCRAVVTGQGYIFAGDYVTGCIKMWKWTT